MGVGVSVGVAVAETKSRPASCTTVYGSVGAIDCRNAPESPIPLFHVKQEFR